MKKFKFKSSSPSEDSTASDDEVPDRDVPSQVKIVDISEINVDNILSHLAKITSDNSSTTENLKEDLKEKEAEKEEPQEKIDYKSYLAQRTKELLEAFPSDKEDEDAKNSTGTTSNYDELNSTSTSSENDNKSDSENSDSNHKKPNKSQSTRKPIIRINLEAPEQSEGPTVRQKKLMKSIKEIYEFFDKKIPVQSIIYAIHDHAGIAKDAIETLNKNPSKYENYSLHSHPSRADEAVINNYLKIFK